ncbi:STE3-like pheromone receptor, partial [Pluteus cervinus]
MPTALIVLPWVSAALLMILLPLQRVRTSIPRCALTCWLLGCSIIEGVNATVWRSNADIRIPVWCDIVTKLLVAGSVGIPGAIMCLAKDLERYSSDRLLCDDGKSRLYRRIIDLVFCCGVPVIVMLLRTWTL